MANMHLHIQQNPNYPYAVGYPLIRMHPTDHPFKVGQEIFCGQWLRNTLGVNSVVVTHIRTVKYHRHGNWINQVRIIPWVKGLNLDQWYAVEHFTEHNSLTEMG